MNETGSEWSIRLKKYIREQLELRGIFSQYRLDTTWSHVVFRCVEKFDKQPMYISTEIRKEAETFIKDIVPKFIKDAWGNPGRVNRIYDSSLEEE